ncbi:hypothetical protein C2G38_2036393 [Gigaspora rosea]|uniref:Protein kinase domain-containing protein n=1 Tax=Gigaspora rosea TaxID=44941 RepID=A0A397VGN5_9GLOM|nr:hypothetical protein C2G38_2036393 [Gigaspora rosea]
MDFSTVNIALKSKSIKICGILPYITPEVLDNRQYTKASDIYSFGITMWEILYGKPIPSSKNRNYHFKYKHVTVYDHIFTTIQQSATQLILIKSTGVSRRISFKEYKNGEMICFRDDLQVEEVKFGTAYRMGNCSKSWLTSNPENWSKENFLALKTTLRNCLPHIRYFQISGDNIIDNVKGTGEILGG